MDLLYASYAEGGGGGKQLSVMMNFERGDGFTVLWIFYLAIYYTSAKDSRHPGSVFRASSH